MTISFEHADRVSMAFTLPVNKGKRYANNLNDFGDRGLMKYCYCQLKSRPSLPTIPTLFLVSLSSTLST